MRANMTMIGLQTINSDGVWTAEERFFKNISKNTINVIILNWIVLAIIATFG